MNLNGDTMDFPAGLFPRCQLINQQPGRCPTDFGHVLGGDRKWRGDVLGEGMIVERNERQVARNRPSGFANGSQAAERDLVAEGEQCGELPGVKQCSGRLIARLFTEVCSFNLLRVPLDSGSPEFCPDALGSFFVRQRSRFSLNDPDVAMPGFDKQSRELSRSAGVF